MLLIIELTTGTSFRALFLVAFARHSFQLDPLKDFCRRWGHQTAVMDRKLYIDGGLLNWNPISQYPDNYTNQWLLYQDLDQYFKGMPQICANLSNNSSIPSVGGGVLWADDVNKRIYLFGGEYFEQSPTSSNMMAYDIWYDQWDIVSNPSANRILGASYGAGVTVSERGEGYYYGGWMSSASVPYWSGVELASPGFIKCTMDTNTLVNGTGPDNWGRAEGPLDQIFVYDIGNGRWYSQNTTGKTPENRRRFCAGATWPDDQSSYNIYLYGGLGFEGEENAAGYDDVYVLSIPSFQWLKIHPLDRDGTGDFPHHSMSCNVINRSQILIIGGSFPLSDNCDAEVVWGTHNLDMGKQNEVDSFWASFNPNTTGYVVPEEITSIIGGSGEGGATKTEPDGGFEANDLRVVLGRKAKFDPREPTRSPPAESKSSNGGLSRTAIAGIAVGISGGIIIGMIVWIVLARRWQLKKNPQAAPLLKPWSQRVMSIRSGATRMFGTPSPVSPITQTWSPVPLNQAVLNISPTTVPPAAVYPAPPIELSGSGHLPPVELAGTAVEQAVAVKN